jgi:outer membrane protein assembly factor BamB
LRIPIALISVITVLTLIPVVSITEEIRRETTTRQTPDVTIDWDNGSLQATNASEMTLPDAEPTQWNENSLSLKWSYQSGCRFGSGLGPLAVDVTGDGIPEVFAAGDRSPSPDKIFCFDGKTGTLRWAKTLRLSIAPHCPMDIYDINNDGDYEIIQPGPNGMQVLRAQDGLFLWTNPIIKGSEAHQLVLDSDHSGTSYIYSCDAATDGSARLRKIDGNTGKILRSQAIWYPCHGGLSGADVDHDGHDELFLGDRTTGNGQGLQCYDADTLHLLWSRPEIDCTSQIPELVDVNRDGILDVVVAQQRNNNAGLYCINGKTGKNIPGYCQDRIPGFASHETFPIYDIDGDGRLEVASCSASPVKIFDLGRWAFDATLTTAGKAPYFANVIGDEKLEIILSDQVSKISIYDGSYQLVGTLPIASRGSTVQDIDGDGLNEIIVYGSNGVVAAYDTSAAALSPLPRTNTNHYSERATRVGIYTAPP